MCSCLIQSLRAPACHTTNRSCSGAEHAMNAVIQKSIRADRIASSSSTHTPCPHGPAFPCRPTSFAQPARPAFPRHVCHITTPETAVASTSDRYSVAAKDVRVQLGSARREVLRGVDMKVKRGQLHMLLGPNGCGKSTLLKLLGGLVPAFTGRVDMDRPSGFVFQNPDHQVVMPTVAADVAFGLGRYKMAEEDVKAAVTSALRLVNMQDYMYRACHTLSGGQRQRVAIAGALAENPKLLLLDELTTFLDVEDQFGVLEAVRNITQVKGDVTAIWVTHRFEELEFADSASYMQDGRIVFTGKPERMRTFLRSLGAPVPSAPDSDSNLNSN